MMKIVSGHAEIYHVHSLLQASGKYHFDCCVLIGDGNGGNSSTKLSNGFFTKKTDHLTWKGGDFTDVLQADGIVKEYIERHEYRYIDTNYPIYIAMPDLRQKIDEVHRNYRHCMDELYPRLTSKIDEEIGENSGMSPETSRNLIEYYELSNEILRKHTEIFKVFAMQKSVEPHPVDFLDGSWMQK